MLALLDILWVILIILGIFLFFATLIILSEKGKRLYAIITLILLLLDILVISQGYIGSLRKKIVYGSYERVAENFITPKLGKDFKYSDLIDPNIRVDTVSYEKLIS